jgi:SAM-dependent methyltransferase
LSEAALARYYDRLSRYVGWARWIGKGGGFADQAMRRDIAPPDGSRPPSPAVHDDLIIERLGKLKAPRVLDAGCGFGGTILRLHKAWGGTYDGLTLSEVQRARAAREADRRGLAAACRFHVRSYDLPPAGPYDVIIGIESLVHSADLRRSLGALARVLAPAGRIVVIDDIPADDLGDDDGDLRAFRGGWMLGSLPTLGGWRDAFVAQGLAIVDQVDLTRWVLPRQTAGILRLERLNRALSATVPVPAVRAVLDSHAGGLAVERLYRRGKMAYRLMIAARQ